MACWIPLLNDKKGKFFMPMCKSCGNDKRDDDGDKYIRRIMGCDEELPEDKEMSLPDGTNTRRCPRVLATGAEKYLIPFNWWDKGQLFHLYSPEETPAFLIEAFSIIVNEREAVKEKVLGS